MNNSQNKNNSLIVKNQPTPTEGKIDFQAFEGVKGNKDQLKKDEEDNDDDYEDDEHLALVFLYKERLHCESLTAWQDEANTEIFRRCKNLQSVDWRACPIATSQCDIWLQREGYFR
ncbi:hypothetical protein CDAR_168681 [Caerostris darwini]|uniref:Uncharacterized protein n=1 Tax=Caerostris darwini TaxID=1538125 RepID=A0AAV4T2X2_9ARAC|nr:hypothetical protein CDAR_168681 [Caerostris darwini]